MPFSFFGSLFGNMTNAMMMQDMNFNNALLSLELNEKNINFQRETNIENRNLVRDINAQQIGLQHEAWNREDNAVQRRMADLRSAGMNPVLAAGGAAQASGPITLNTPRDEAPQGRHLAHMQAAQIQTDLVERMLRMRDDFATNEASRRVMAATADEHNARADQIRTETGLWGDESFGLRARDMISTIEYRGVQEAMLVAQQETERLRQDHISAQTMNEISRNVSIELDNLFQERTFETRVSREEQEVIKQEVANELARHDADIRMDLGVTSDGSFQEKAFQYVRRLGERLTTWLVESKERKGTGFLGPFNQMRRPGVIQTIQGGSRGRY